MFKAAIGSSVGDDSYREGANAAQQAKDALGSDKVSLFIVFASSKYEQEKLVAGVKSVEPSAVLVGCSTAGEITTPGPSNKPSIAVMAIATDDIEFIADVGEHIKYNPHEAGKEVAQKVKQKAEDMNLFVMLPDVLAGNGADIVRGVSEVLGEFFPVVGGAAGDDFKFVQTYQYLNDKVYSGAVVGMGIKGNVQIGIGVKHGWLPIGLPMKVTKSKGSVLYELDNKPAVDLYKDYFGEKLASELQNEKLARLAITYPLGMKVDGHDEMLIRDALSVESDGSLTCAAEIPEGAHIQLMMGSREEAIRAAQEAAQSAREQLGSATPRAIIIFNCIARHKLFGEFSGEEIKAIQKAIGADVPLIGFYTYGEQAPMGNGIKNINKCSPAFHNETVVICVLGQ
ncbi:MAG: hypothetical protein RLY57_499 [Candidatus Parcubacteria bacterium]|jgi:hypothetical protein